MSCCVPPAAIDAVSGDKAMETSCAGGGVAVTKLTVPCTLIVVGKVAGELPAFATVVLMFEVSPLAVIAAPRPSA